LCGAGVGGSAACAGGAGVGGFFPGAGFDAPCGGASAGGGASSCAAVASASGAASSGAASLGESPAGAARLLTTMMVLWPAWSVSPALTALTSTASSSTFVESGTRFSAGKGAVRAQLT
jgi:hypothetical protein